MKKLAPSEFPQVPPESHVRHSLTYSSGLITSPLRSFG